MVLLTKSASDCVAHLFSRELSVDPALEALLLLGLDLTSAAADRGEVARARLA